MRVRPLPLLVAIFGAAALASFFVVRQLPREGQTSGPSGTAVAPAAATPRLGAPPAPGEGALDVLVTAGGEPQAGAGVRAYLAVAEPPGWRIAAEERTGPAGLARLAVPPGSVLVSARAPGLAPGLAEASRAPGVEGVRVEVALSPPVSIEGRIVSREGPAVAGAIARALPAAGGWPGAAPPRPPGEEIVRGTSDASGVFRLEGLSPGSFTLEVEAAGFHPFRLPRVAVPGPSLPVALEPLGAIEGRVLRADGTPAAGASVLAASADHGAAAAAGADGLFRLSVPAGSYRLQASAGERAGETPGLVPVAAGGPASRAEIVLGPAAAIEGTVVFPSHGSARARVVAFPHDTREPAAVATTDPGGRFRIEGLPAGAYDVRASAPGATPALLRGVTVSPGKAFALRIALPGLGSVTGIVRDPAGRPLAGVRVAVTARGDGGESGPPLEVRTGFDGEFALHGVEAGRAVVVAREEGVAIGASQAVRIVDSGTSRADLVLPASGLLAGRVRAGSAPLPPGTTVIATSMRGGPGVLQAARAAADATGNYRLPLPEGEYRVLAAPSAGGRDEARARPAFARVEPGRTTKLDLPAPAAAVEPGAEILVLEPGGAPSPGAEVTLARPGDATVAFATTAGEDGRVFLGEAMGLSGRTATIRARNGGRRGEATVEVPAAGTIPVHLAPGGAIRGVVRARGRGVTGLTVEVASQPAASGWRTVDVHRFAGDRFEIPDLPAEPLRLDVRTDDGRRGRAELRVASGEVRSVEIALEGR